MNYVLGQTTDGTVRFAENNPELELIVINSEPTIEKDDVVLLIGNFSINPLYEITKQAVLKAGAQFKYKL